MASFGKVDNVGRSSGKSSGRIGRLMKPPKDVSWVWLRRDLMLSDAWLKQSRICRLFVDALLLDLMANAGQENGRLKATYDQLDDLGLSRSSVSKAIAEAAQLGLACCMKKGGRYGGTNRPSEYRLTFYPMLSDEGVFCHATNDWKRITSKDVMLWKENRKLKRTARQQHREKQKAGPRNKPSPDRTLGLATAKLKVVQ